MAETLKALELALRTMRQQLPKIEALIEPLGTIWEKESENIFAADYLDTMISEVGDAYESLERAVHVHKENMEYVKRRIRYVKANNRGDTAELTQIRIEAIEASAKRVAAHQKKEAQKAARQATKPVTSMHDKRIEFKPATQKNHFRIFFNHKPVGTIFKSRVTYQGETILRFVLTKTGRKKREKGKLIVEPHTVKHRSSLTAWRVPGDQFRMSLFTDAESAALALVQKGN